MADRRARIQELREKRANLWNEMDANLEAAHAEGRGLAGDFQTKHEALEADMAALERQIGAEETALDAEARLARTIEDTPTKDERGNPVSRDEYDSIFRRFLQVGAADLEPRERQILMGAQTDVPEARALGVAAGGAGGYTVPEGFWNKVTETQKAYGRVQAVANQITTATGQDLPWMGNDDTANEGAILGENTQISEQDVTFTVKSLSAYVYTSKLVRVSFQLLQDSSLDVEAFLARKFAERLGRITNRHFTVGTGVSQPDGIVTGATVGKTAASATVVTYDELIDLVHSVDPAYRVAGRVRWMFADGVLAALRKIRDDSGGAGVGRPLWQPSITAGEPDTFLGYPYEINQNMPAQTTGQKSILFGDFESGYVVRTVKGLSVIRLNERYADYLQVGFFAFQRQDGTVDDAAAFKALAQA